MPKTGITLARLFALGSIAFSASAMATLPADCSSYLIKTLDAAQVGQGKTYATFADAIVAKLTESDVVMGIGVELRLSGSFSTGTKAMLGRDCVRVLSADAGNPATLTWSGPYPVGVNQYPSIFDGNNNTARHHLGISNLKFVNGGIELAGSQHTVSGNSFSTGMANIEIGWGDTIKVVNNTFTDVGGIGASQIHNSLIDHNTFTRTVQPFHVTAEGHHNTFSNNTATGTVYFGVELFGASGLTASQRFLGNRIVNNSFTAPAARTPGNHGAYGAISVINGTANEISGNVIDCGTTCRMATTYDPVTHALKASYSLQGDLDGYGIEVCDANSNVHDNIVRGFNVGILACESPDGHDVSTDTATIQGNKVYTTNYGIAMNCTPGAANGLEPTREGITRCRKAYVISGNVVQEARDIGIGGVMNFYYPTWTNGRYVMNMASESTAITINGNTVIRTYGAFPGDSTVKLPQSRFTGVTVGPILNPALQSVTGNTITLKGTPPAGSQYSYKGLQLSLPTKYDGAPACTTLTGAQSLAGLKLDHNTVTHMNTVLGTGISSSCHASDGTAITGNGFTNLVYALDELNSTAAISGNTCQNVSNARGCQ